MFLKEKLQKLKKFLKTLNEGFFIAKNLPIDKSLEKMNKVRIDNLKKIGYILEVIWKSDFDKQTTLQNIINKYVKN